MDVFGWMEVCVYNTYYIPSAPLSQIQAGQHKEALRLLGRMEAKGIKNVVALTSAMTACEAGRAYEEGKCVCRPACGWLVAFFVCENTCARARVCVCV